MKQTDKQEKLNALVEAIKKANQSLYRSDSNSLSNAIQELKQSLSAYEQSEQSEKWNRKANNKPG